MDNSAEDYPSAFADLLQSVEDFPCEAFKDCDWTTGKPGKLVSEIQYSEASDVDAFDSSAEELERESSRGIATCIAVKKLGKGA